MEQYYIQLLVILVIVTSEYIALSSVAEIVSVSKEEDVTLSCLNSTMVEPRNCYRVKWIKHATGTREEKVVLSVWPKKIRSNYHAKGGSDKDVNDRLFLTKLQKSDEGHYSCEIWRGWDLVHIKNISLKVKDCKALPPVEAEPGTNIQLNCPVNTTLTQQRPYNISWAKLKGSDLMPYVNSKRVEINGTSMTIQSVNTTESGWYRCSYMYGQTQRCFDINLLVQVKSVFVTTTVWVTVSQTQQVTVTVHETAGTSVQEKEGSDVLFAVVVSVIIGIILIAALTGMFIYRRRRKIQRARMQPQVQTTDTCIETMAGYEPLDFTLPRGNNAQKVNSLYRFPDENFHTFQL